MKIPDGELPAPLLWVAGIIGLPRGKAIAVLVEEPRQHFRGEEEAGLVAPHLSNKYPSCFITL